MKKVSMQQYLADLREKEAEMREDSAVTAAIAAMAKHLSSIDKDEIVIRTDYDADGICSAYIMKRTLQVVFPGKTIDVRVNDRRGSYAALEDPADPSVQYIVMDMGSNALPALKERYGDFLCIDHHLVNDASDREEIATSSRILNCKTIGPADAEFADYCTTGLAYRLYEELAKGCPALSDEKLHNSLVAMAAVGTVADVVDLMDRHSKNRMIVKEGLNAINNADKTNFDERLGYLFSVMAPDIDGIDGNPVTANTIRMGIAPWINGAGRMSSVWNKNGSQEIFDLFFKDDNYTMRCIQDLTVQKKDVMKKVQNSQAYTDFLSKNVYANGVLVFVTPEEVEHSFCGLVASKLSEALDAPILALTYNAKSKSYSGSGRNPAGRAPLKAFMDAALDGKDVNIIYGGHDDAIGISHLAKKDLKAFEAAIAERNLTVGDVALSTDNLVVLDLSFSELKSKKAEILAFLSEIEPSAEPCYLAVPPVFEQKPAKDIPYMTVKKAVGVGNVASWQKMTLLAPDGKTTLAASDWGFYPEKYRELPLLVELEADYYGANKKNSKGEKYGPSVGCTICRSRAYEREYLPEMLHVKAPAVSDAPKKKETAPEEPPKKTTGWAAVGPVKRRAQDARPAELEWER